MPVRKADPITNFYNILMSPGRHTFVLTSAVGWGLNYMTSASIASTEFITYMEKHQIKILDTQSAAKIILKAIHHAHRGIAAGLDYTRERGVMLAGGLALRLPTLDDEKKSSWALVCANIGHNKIFYWNHNLKQLTLMNKLPSDYEGKNTGQIGGVSDLTNLDVYTQFCEENERDIILIMSPIAFSNFDSENLGIPFKEVSSFQKWKKYSRVPEDLKEIDIVANIEKRLQSLKEDTPTNFVEEIISKVREVTKAKRNFLMTNDEHAKGYSKLTGKMGHAACIALRIADVIPSTDILKSVERTLSLSNESVQRMERAMFLKQSTFNKFKLSRSPSGKQNLTKINET